MPWRHWQNGTPFGVGSQQPRPREWVVYAKRPFREPVCILKYLARYTHRVAISNRHLLGYHAGRVTFRYKDYAQAGRSRQMTLSASEFIRRFLLHVLPKGFMRIRHYGYLANRHRQQKLALCRRLVGDVNISPPNESCQQLTVAPAAPDDQSVALLAVAS